MEVQKPQSPRIIGIRDQTDVQISSSLASCTPSITLHALSRSIVIPMLHCPINTAWVVLVHYWRHQHKFSESLVQAPYWHS